MKTNKATRDAISKMKTILQEDGSLADEQTVLRRMTAQGLDPDRAKAHIQASRAAAKKKSAELIAAADWVRNADGTMSPR